MDPLQPLQATSMLQQVVSPQKSNREVQSDLFSSLKKFEIVRVRQ